MPIKRRITSVQPMKTPVIPAPVKKTVPKWVVFVLVVLLLLAAGGFVWAYLNYQRVAKKAAELSLTEMQRQEIKKQVDELVAKVGKHIVLPEGEAPTVADIVNVDVLAKDQPFYAGARNGDKLLIYFKAQRAYIYDPVRDVLVNVGPVMVQNKPEAVKPAKTTTTTQ